MYDSDRKYLDELIGKHLFSKTQFEHDSPPNNIEQSANKPSNPKTENNPKPENNLENNPKTQESFCGNCGASKAKEHDFYKVWTTK